MAVIHPPFDYNLPLHYITEGAYSTTATNPDFAYYDFWDGNVSVTYFRGFICNVTTPEGGVIPNQLLTIEEIDACRKLGYYVIVEPDQ